MEKNKRLQWVSIAKGIAITAVVLGHISYLYPSNKLIPLPEILFKLWHVPVFFIIGGFFIKEDKLRQPIVFMKGKFKSLYMLILYIYLPTLLFHNFFINIGFYDLTTEYYGKYVVEWDVIDLVKNMIMSILLAGREPILGAMWFVYSLFIALCSFSVISWMLNMLFHNGKVYELVRCCVLLLMAIISCTLTNIWGITIPRVSNTIVGLWLIYVGMQLRQRYKIEFSNFGVFIVSVIIVYHQAIVVGGVSIAGNKFRDVTSLTIISCACLYVICYIAKMIERNRAGLLLAVIGENSFYIMGLHFVSFKLFSVILNSFGFCQNLALLKPDVKNSFTLLFGYVLFGVFVPIAFVSIIKSVWRKGLNMFQNK